MKSTLLSRRDLDFLLFEWLRVEDLTKRERFAEHSGETFSDVLDLCEQLATRYFFRYELPKTAPQLDLLESLDRTTLEMCSDWF